MQRTAFYDRHRQLGAKMTEFHGWEMPLYYTGIIEEHKAVREALGVFDVSHMGQVLVTGPDALATLNALLVSDISQVGEGRACYTLMLNETGGILDDLIVFRLGVEEFLVIVNCATHESDVAWLTSHAQGRTTIADISEGRCIVAVQGPRACRVLEQVLDARVTSLGRFQMAPIRTMGPDACIARTGYTGGDGFELFLPNAHGLRVWDLVLSHAKAIGACPIGLGARDTLRVEAGLRLYGTDMDATTTPFDAGLGWTVAMNKTSFIGKDVLVQQKHAGIKRHFVGFELSQGPMPRHGCDLCLDGRPVGTVTSGTFSQVLNRPIGMGYVEPSASTVGTVLTMTVRAQKYQATVVKLPFWKGTIPSSMPSRQAAGGLTARPTMEKLS